MSHAVQAQVGAVRDRLQSLVVGDFPRPLFAANLPDRAAVVRCELAWLHARPGSRQRVLVQLLQLATLRLSGPAAANADLAVLPSTTLQRLFLARALYARIDSLRRCIDRQSRAWFVQVLGEAGWVWLITRFAPPTTIALFPYGTDPHLWYRDGWQRLCADGVWTCPALVRLTELAAGFLADDSSGAAEILPDGRSQQLLTEWRQFQGALAE